MEAACEQHKTDKLLGEEEARILGCVLRLNAPIVTLNLERVLDDLFNRSTMTNSTNTRTK